jgi:predicted GNAT family N-acyltransferase
MCDVATELKAGAPSIFSDQEIADFKSLAISGGQVSKLSLPRLISAASRLVVLLSNGELIGCAAIKRPADAYRAKVFKKSELENKIANYPHELGWVVVKQSFWGKDYSSKLIESALSDPNISGIFATSQASNKRMHDKLVKFGFERSGCPYDSKEKADEQVFVFLKK